MSYHIIELSIVFKLVYKLILALGSISYSHCYHDNQDKALQFTIVRCTINTPYNSEMVQSYIKINNKHTYLRNSTDST